MLIRRTSGCIDDTAINTGLAAETQTLKDAWVSEFEDGIVANLTDALSADAEIVGNLNLRELFAAEPVGVADDVDVSLLEGGIEEDV